MNVRPIPSPVRTQHKSVSFSSDVDTQIQTQQVKKLRKQTQRLITLSDYYFLKDRAKSLNLLNEAKTIIETELNNDPVFLEKYECRLILFSKYR